MQGIDAERFKISGVHIFLFFFKGVEEGERRWRELNEFLRGGRKKKKKKKKKKKRKKRKRKNKEKKTTYLTFSYELGSSTE